MPGAVHSMRSLKTDPAKNGELYAFTPVATELRFGKWPEILATPAGELPVPSFAYVNGAKRSVTLDPNTGAGAQLLGLRQVRPAASQRVGPSPLHQGPRADRAGPQPRRDHAGQPR